MAMVPMKVARCGRFQKVAHIFCAGAFLASPVISQVLMTGSETGGSVRLFASDAAILEAGETRKDIPCTVTPIKQPFLGFDLKFHAGYEVSVPLKELAGSDNHLTMVFRVYPDHKPEDASYFSQHWNVPAIDQDAGGNALLTGIFDVGEGQYH